MARKNARLKRKCEGKKSYSSQAEAQPHVAQLWKQGKVKPAYHCKFCNKWHVGGSAGGSIKEKVMKGFKLKGEL